MAARNVVLVRRARRPLARRRLDHRGRYIIASKDRLIDPEQEAAMAQGIGATTSRLPSSHAVMLSHPKEVADVIVQAAETSGAR